MLSISLFVPFLFGGKESLVALLLRFLLQMQCAAQKFRESHHIFDFVIVILDHAEFIENEFFDSVARFGRITAFEIIVTI